MSEVRRLKERWRELGEMVWRVGSGWVEEGWYKWNNPLHMSNQIGTFLPFHTTQVTHAGTESSSEMAAVLTHPKAMLLLNSLLTLFKHHSLFKNWRCWYCSSLNGLRLSWNWRISGGCMGHQGLRRALLTYLRLSAWTDPRLAFPMLGCVWISDCRSTILQFNKDESYQLSWLSKGRIYRDRIKAGLILVNSIHW